MSHELILHDFFIFQYFKLVCQYLGYILFLYSISIFAFLLMLLVNEDKHIKLLMTQSRPVMHNVRPAHGSEDCGRRHPHFSEQWVVHEQESCNQDV